MIGRKVRLYRYLFYDDVDKSDSAVCNDLDDDCGICLGTHLRSMETRPDEYLNINGLAIAGFLFVFCIDDYTH